MFGSMQSKKSLIVGESRLDVKSKRREFNSCVALLPQKNGLKDEHMDVKINVAKMKDDTCYRKCHIHFLPHLALVATGSSLCRL